MYGILIAIVLLAVVHFGTNANIILPADLYKWRACAKLRYGLIDLESAGACARELATLKDPLCLDILRRLKRKAVDGSVWSLREFHPTRMIVDPDVIRHILKLSSSSTDVFERIALGKDRPHDQVHVIAIHAATQAAEKFARKIVVAGNDFEELGYSIACNLVLGREPHDVRRLLSDGWHSAISRAWANPIEHSLVANAKVLHGLYPVDNVFDVVKSWIIMIAAAVSMYVPVFFVLLFSHPEVERALQKDADTLQYTDTHLHHAVTECMRMYRIGEDIVRKLPMDVRVGNSVLLAGSTVELPMTALTRDHMCFPNHNSFDISRWWGVDSRAHAAFHGSADDVVRTIVKTIVHVVVVGTEFEVLEPVVDRDNLPHVIESAKVRMGLRRRKAPGFGLRFRDD